MNRLMQWSAALLGAAMPLVFDAALKGILLLLLAALCVLALQRASASTRHLVWLIAVVALLVVPILSVCLPQWRVLPRWAAAPAMKIQPAAQPQIMREAAPSRIALSSGSSFSLPPASSTAGDPALPIGAATPHPAAAGPVMTASPEVTAAASGWRAWLPMLWICGFAMCALRLLLAYWLLRRTEADCAEVTGGRLRDVLTGTCAQLGVRQRVCLLVDARRTIPVVWGVWRPRLVLPAEAERWEERQLQSVLLHELAHIRRRDTAAQWLIQIACALHWFNPLVWLAAWRLHAERERACDDLVLASGVRASDYAEHLLHVATKLEGAGWASACGLAMARPSRLEGRLLAVLSDRQNRRRVTALLAAVVLALGACIAIPLAMLRAAEEAWNPPQAAHLGSNTRSIYSVHDGRESAFVLFHEGMFNSSTESGNNPKTRTWTDAGRVTLEEGGKTFAFYRDHTAPDSLTLNGAAYDLTQGRVFYLGKDGSLRQLALNAPAVTDQAGLTKVAERILGRLAATPPQIQEVRNDELTTEQREEREKALEAGLKSARAGRDKARQSLEAARAAGASAFDVETLAGDLKLWEVSVKMYEEILERMGKKMAETEAAPKAKVVLSYTPRPAVDAATIQTGEELDIFVKEDPTFSGHYPVSPGGKITLAVIGSLKVSGQTYEQAEQSISEALTSVFPTRRFAVWIARKKEAQAAPAPTPVRPAPAQGEMIVPGSKLAIFVSEDTSYNGDYQVRRGGYIILPQIGRVAVAGKTLAEAEQAVEKALRATQLPKATVKMKYVEALLSAGDRSATPETSVVPAPGAKSGSDARPPAAENLAGSDALSQLPMGGLSLETPVPKWKGELSLQSSAITTTRVITGTVTGPLVSIMDSVGRHEVWPGVWLDIPVPEPGKPTVGVLHWLAKRGRSALRYEFQILSGSDWKTQKWVLGVSGTVMWIVTEEKGAAPMLRQILFDKPEEIVENFQKRREHEPIRGLNIPASVAQALERRLSIPKPTAEEEKTLAAPKADGQQIHVAQPEEEWMGGRKAPDLDAKPTGSLTPTGAAGAEQVFVASAVGRWELGNDVSLEIPKPAAGEALKAIVRWPARGQWPALRHEIIIASADSLEKAKWAVGWVPGKAALWTVAEEPGYASMLRQIVYQQPEKIFDNMFGRRAQEPISGLEIPAVLAREMEKNFTIVPPDPKEERLPRGPYMGGQQIHAAETEAVWSVEGFVRGADGKPLANMEVEAHCEHYPLKVLDQTRTDGEGHYVVRFRLGVETLAAFRGVQVWPKLTGFAEKELSQSGEFNAVLMAGEKLEHPFATRELVLGETGRADFELRKGCILTGQIVDPEGHPIPRQFIAVRAPGQRLGYSIASAEADAEGRFVLPNIPAGTPVLLQTATFQKPYQSGETKPVPYTAGRVYNLKVVVKNEDETRETVTVEIPESPQPAVAPKGTESPAPGIPK